MNETDLMQLARQAIEDEDTARLNAKAAELATADEAARLAAAKEARTEELKAAAEEAMNAEGVTLSDLARKFDTAVAALADLANAACTRNEVIGRHAAGIQAAELQRRENEPRRRSCWRGRQRWPRMRSPLRPTAWAVSPAACWPTPARCTGRRQWSAPPGRAVRASLVLPPHERSGRGPGPPGGLGPRKYRPDPRPAKG
ncbi:hypothetical protein SMICM304S_05515 [Streptomyces microflavus]